MRRAALVLVIVFWGAAAAAQTGWHRQDCSARRQVTVYVPERRLPGDEAAMITFYTAGLAREDGSDIRVMAGTRELPHKVYGMGPGDTATIAFLVKRDVREYYVYFGNPEASPPETDWEPQRGLILETRRRAGGNPTNVKNARNIWQNSTSFDGAGPVDRIWHGQNMFGPTEDFVSRYVGWLICPAAGRYGFATTSDDASFLLLNGEEVVSWPGWHGPVGDIRHNKTVTLGAGIHRLEYLHVNGGEWTCAVAAWRPPGASGFSVIPEGAFAPLSRAVVGPLELQGRRVACDFETAVAGEALMSTEEEVYAVKMAFANRTAGMATSIVSWDFGDGEKGRGPMATHIYLKEGIYPVTMTLGRGAGAASVTNRVQVHEHWGWQTKKEIDDITIYFKEIARYDIENLDVASCLSLLKLAREQGSPDFIKRVGLSVVARAESVDRADLSRALDALRDALGPGRLSGDDALISVYGKAFEATAGAKRALLGVALSDLLLERGAVDEAAAFAKAVLVEGAEDLVGRRAFLTYADAARYMGDAPAAANALRAAGKIPLERSSVQDTALTGALALQVEDFLAHRQYDEAEETLDRWDWEKPLEKLVGYSSYLRGKLYFAQKRNARAAMELMALVSTSPDSAYAPQALLLVAEVEKSRGDLPAAKRALDRILADYATSAQAREAREALRGFGGL